MKPRQTNTVQSGVAEVELVYHNKVKAADRPKVATAADAYRILLDHWNKETIELLEEFKVMLLNQNCGLLGIYNLSKGGISATFVDPRLIYAAALKAAASSIILAHNHPDGELKPSRADEELTRNIAEGSKLLELKVNDHLIISPEHYFHSQTRGCSSPFFLSTPKVKVDISLDSRSKILINPRYLIRTIPSATWGNL